MKQADSAPWAIRAAAKAEREKQRKQLIKKLRLEFHQNESLWYSQRYAKEVGCSYEQYFPLWEVLCSWIGPQEQLLDLGCGIGEFAKFAIARQKNYLLGVDFSDEAVRQAIINNPEQSDRFVIMDLYSPVLPEADVYLFSEVVEHLEHDLKALADIVPVGKHTVISLPSFDCTSHYRFFKSKSQCEYRYSPLFDIRKIKRIGKFYALNCVRKA